MNWQKEVFNYEDRILLQQQRRRRQNDHIFHIDDQKRVLANPPASLLKNLPANLISDCPAAKIPTEPLVGVMEADVLF